MVDGGRGLIIGGGIFGLTTAIVLGESGHQVTVIEKSPDFLHGASQVNQNRVHMGYHYPRSINTVMSSLKGFETFNQYYGASIVHTFKKYYAVAREGSFLTPKEFSDICANCGIALTEAYPSGDLLNTNTVDACWLVPERIFDYHNLRQIILTRVADCKNIHLLRCAEVTDIKIGRPYSVTISDKIIDEYDFIVNASYAGISDFVNLLGSTPITLQYELAFMPIMSLSEPIPRFGITIMDGPFCSLMPKGLYESEYILAHVSHTPVQRVLSISRPHWSPFKGFPEKQLIEASEAYFPILKRMVWRDNWITTKVVLPYQEQDDSRPTFLIEHLPGVYSLFTGKLTTCVDYANEVLRYVEMEASH